MKGKDISKRILRLASVLLLVFAMVKTQGIIAQAATTNYTESIDGIEWKVSVVTNGGVTIEPVTPSGLSGAVVIPDTVNGYTVTALGSRAFANCTKITSIQVPGSISVIGASAFTNCTKLADVTLSAGVNSIGALTFKNCTSLKSIYIPDSLNYIEPSAFNDCTYLNGIEVDAGNVNYCSIDGVLYNKAMTEVVRFSEGNANDTYAVPAGVTKVGNYAFSNCDNLTSITLPSTLKTIGDYAFLGSSKIAAIALPENVTAIGVYAFSGCSALADVELSDSIATIGYYAFTQCTSLETVKLPAALKQLSAYTFDQCTSLKSVEIQANVSNILTTAFNQCSSLESVTVAEENKYYSSKDGALLNKAQTELIYVPNGISGIYEIPDTVAEIGSNTFLNIENLTDVIIPDSVKSIASSAFYNCAGLVNVLGGNKVEEIGANAFYRCKSLENITLSDSLTTIGKQAFLYCSALKEIEVPANVTEIGTKAFYYCTSLEEINVANANEVYCSEDGILYDKAQTTVILCPTGWTKSAYVTPETVTTISNSAFSSDAITEVELTEGVATVEANAFVYCDNLKMVTLPTSLTTIGSNAFYVPIDQGYDVVNYFGTTEQWNSLLEANSLSNLSGLKYAAQVNCLGDSSENTSSLSGDFAINSEWDSDYNVTFTVTNNSESAISNWKVQFSSEDEISNIWCAEIASHENGIYVITNASWNGTLQPGESMSFGFSMSKSGAEAIVPDDIMVTTEA